MSLLSVTKEIESSESSDQGQMQFMLSQDSLLTSMRLARFSRLLDEISQGKKISSVESRLLRKLLNHSTDKERDPSARIKKRLQALTYKSDGNF